MTPRLLILLAAALAAVVAAAPARAADPFAAIVRLRSEVPDDARTARTLSTSRGGSAIVIDGSGLALTIGYIVLEATKVELVLDDDRVVAADIVAYDHDTGFGLVRANEPLGIVPIELGDSAALVAGTPAIIAAFGGSDNARPALVVSRREFAGYWEYLLDAAIFTSPPYPLFSGAALLGADGKLLGVGSLQVSDAAHRDGRVLPGNMFVPIEALLPALGSMLGSGHGGGPSKPWLGLYSSASDGRVYVRRVASDSPAERAGIKAGDLVMAVEGNIVRDLASFYRAVWARGEAGTSVKLQVLQDNEPREFAVESMDRYDWLRLR